tara:strand:- start:92 stop:1402 length:1311 start_codon:yes stop_codon:yes gene_type:complete
VSLNRFAVFASILLIAMGASAGNPDDLTCAESSTPFPNPAIKFHVCNYEINDTYGPAGFTMSYPVGFLVPTATGQYPIVLHWDGYGNASNCPTWDFSKAGQIIVKNCNDYYPTAATHMVDGVTPWGFGGPFFGNSPAERYTTAVRKIDQLWGDSVDTGAGLTLKGNSYGASTSLLQPLMFGLVDPDIQARITKINAGQAPMGFLDEGGLYQETNNIQVAWDGFDTSKADHELQAEQLKFMYFFLQGSPADVVVFFHQDWLQRVCDEHRLSCYALWHDCGHALPNASCAANLPYNEMFAGSNQDVRLDDPFIVAFTESTANIWGDMGGYNLGLAWDSRTMTTTEYTAQVDIRYSGLTDIHEDIADQPQEASLKVTLRMRPSSLLSLELGDTVEWSLNEQTGQGVVLVPGEITVPVTLQSTTAYSTLTVTKTGRIPGC